MEFHQRSDAVRCGTYNGILGSPKKPGRSTGHWAGTIPPPYSQRTKARPRKPRPASNRCGSNKENHQGSWGWGHGYSSQLYMQTPPGRVSERLVLRPLGASCEENCAIGARGSRKTWLTAYFWHVPIFWLTCPLYLKTVPVTEEKKETCYGPEVGGALPLRRAHRHTLEGSEWRPRQCRGSAQM